MVDLRDLNVMASIADIAAKVVNDRQKTNRTLSHTQGMSPETVHATLHKDMSLSKKLAGWISRVDIQTAG